MEYMLKGRKKAREIFTSPPYAYASSILLLSMLWRGARGEV
jgi:hypothetical protein